MARISINTNLSTVTGKLQERLNKLRDKDYLLRPVMFDLIDLMTKRIHIDGKASDEAPIGTYSKGYLALRQREYNRNNDPKVIVSLTRQLENDWSVIATDKGYGIGFKNPFNLQKARWVEETKSKRIFSLSPSEEKYASDYFNDLVNKALNE